MQKRPATRKTAPLSRAARMQWQEDSRLLSKTRWSTRNQLDRLLQLAKQSVIANTIANRELNTYLKQVAAVTPEVRGVVSPTKDLGLQSTTEPLLQADLKHDDTPEEKHPPARAEVALKRSLPTALQKQEQKRIALKLAEDKLLQLNGFLPWVSAQDLLGANNQELWKAFLDWLPRRRDRQFKHCHAWDPDQHPLDDEELRKRLETHWLLHIPTRVVYPPRDASNPAEPQEIPAELPHIHLDVNVSALSEDRGLPDASTSALSASRTGD